jgi:hypothetical protein
MHHASIASVIVPYLLALATGPASAATAIADGEIILDTAVEPVRGRGGEAGRQGATTSHAEAWRGGATPPDGFSIPTADGEQAHPIGERLQSQSDWGVPEISERSTAVSRIKGIWSIANGPAKQHRWLIVHDHFESGGTNVYHIEVIARAAGAPAWQIGRLAPHMAITEPALKRSIVKPLTRGGVYPEAFHDARAAWQAANGGAGGAVCATSVRECLSK